MNHVTLIVICGAPASGKTTLARRLASDLRLPLLQKDVIKEAVAEVLGTPDRNASRRIGTVSMNVMFALACDMLRRGTSIMIESNFLLRFAAADLARMAQFGDVQLVQCAAPADLIDARYRQRTANGQRHAVHFDRDALPDLLVHLERGAYDLTSLPYSIIVVDTTAGYAPPYAAILEELATSTRFHP